MKKALCLIFVIILLCGCSDESSSNQSYADTYSGDSTFTRNENGKVVSSSGVEYALLANEGTLYYLGDLEFIGGIKGEEKSSEHLGVSYQTGMFAIKGSDNDNILIRYSPNNEWAAIYRKTSLSHFDFSVDNCTRMEFVPGIGDIKKDAIHTSCGDGMTDQLSVSAFLSQIRKQKDPEDAGLYDLVKQPDGMLENCYIYGVLYGFFAEEPNLAVRMEITSYNDLAYSISIEEKEYALPAEWLERLKNK